MYINTRQVYIRNQCSGVEGREGLLFYSVSVRKHSKTSSGHTMMNFDQERKKKKNMIKLSSSGIRDFGHFGVVFANVTRLHRLRKCDL